MKRNSVILILTLMVGGTAGAQEPPGKGDESLRTATRAGDEALKTFALLVNRTNYEAMGFDSPEQVRSATLGPLLEDFMVRLDELRKYESGKDPGPLLQRTGRATFPVLVQDRTRSSVTLASESGRWTAVSFGAPKYARALSEVRSQLSQQEGKPPSDYFEVRVPALNVTFIGRRRDGRILLSPVVEDPRFGFKRGQTLPAEEAFAAMTRAAREHNDLPT